MSYQSGPNASAAILQQYRDLLDRSLSPVQTIRQDAILEMRDLPISIQLALNTERSRQVMARANAQVNTQVDKKNAKNGLTP